MPKSKKNRNSGTPRGSQYIDGQLIHTESRQKLFFQTHLCTINRETLKPNENFKAIDAVAFMEKHKKKRQSHSVGSILEDRITIEKDKKSGNDPFRKWVGYNEIEAIQRSESKKEYFVMSVNSAETGNKYYEVYKCKSKEDTSKFMDYIKQAMADPEKRIRSGPAIDVVTVVDDPNLRRSMVHIDFQTSQDSLDDDYRVSTVYQNTSPTPPAGYATPSPPPPKRQPSPVTVPQVVYQPVVRTEAPRPESPRQPPPPLRRSPSPKPTRSINGLDNVTYIKHDPKTHRPRASLDGPIYMYLQRHKNTAGSSMRKHGSTDLGYGTYNDNYYADQYAY